MTKIPSATLHTPYGEFKISGPFLFADIIQTLRPLPSSFLSSKRRAETKKICAAVEKEIRKRFREVGAPSLPRVDHLVLDDAGFRRAVQQVTGKSDQELAEIDWDGWNCFTTHDVFAHQYGLTVRYRFPSLTRPGAESLSMLVVHETCTGIYMPPGQPVKQAVIVNPDAGVNYDLALSCVGEGWANYFSGAPFSVDKLIVGEIAAFELESYDLDLRANLEQHYYSDLHFWSSLALLKIEMAFDFERLVQLMSEQDKLTKEGGGNILYGLWLLYKTANERIGRSFVSFEKFSTNRGSEIRKMKK